jgi:hypothetical protein
VFVLTETWFSDSDCDGLDGYTAFHVHRGIRRGGGVSIYIRDSLGAKVKLITSFMSDHIELCVVNLHFPSNVFMNIVGVYRPPDRGTINQSVDIWQISLTSAIEVTTQLYVGI